MNQLAPYISTIDSPSSLSPLSFNLIVNICKESKENTVNAGTYSLIHTRTHSLTYSLIHSLTHSLTHLLTYSLVSGDCLQKVLNYPRNSLTFDEESIYQICTRAMDSDNRDNMSVFSCLEGLNKKGVSRSEVEECIHARYFTHSLTHSLTYFLTYLLTHSLTHLLTHSLI